MTSMPLTLRTICCGVLMRASRLVPAPHAALERIPLAGRYPPPRGRGQCVGPSPPPSRREVKGREPCDRQSVTASLTGAGRSGLAVGGRAPLDLLLRGVLVGRGPHHRFE